MRHAQPLEAMAPSDLGVWSLDIERTDSALWLSALLMMLESTCEAS